MRLVRLTGANREPVYLNPLNVLDLKAEGPATSIRLSASSGEETTRLVVKEPLEVVADLISVELDSPRRWLSASS